MITVDDLKRWILEKRRAVGLASKDHSTRNSYALMAMPTVASIPALALMTSGNAADTRNFLHRAGQTFDRPPTVGSVGSTGSRLKDLLLSLLIPTAAPHYNPATHHVNLGLDPARPPHIGVIAHEYGHATVGPTRGAIGRRLAGNLGASAAVFLLPPILPGQLAISDKDTARNTAIASTAMQLPMLGDEIAASHIGSRLLAQHRITPEMSLLNRIKLRGSPYVGLSSYLGMASLPGLLYAVNKDRYK